MNGQNSSNEAKTSLANVSSPKVNSLEPDHARELANLLADDLEYSGFQQTVADGPTVEFYYHGHKYIASPISQDGASAAAQTQDVIDHSPASPPESESSISSTLAEIRERAQQIVIDASHASGYADTTWMDGVFKYKLTERIATELESIEVKDDPGRWDLILK